MTSSAGTLTTSSGLLQAERQAILHAAHRMIAVATTDPAVMSREELADAVGGLVATSEHAALRDNHCQHPGCKTPARWCDTDHITPWDPGGPTLIANGQLLCKFHHRWKHRNDPGCNRPTHFDDSRLSPQLE